MPTLPKAGAQLELDTSAWDSAFKGVMADAGKIDGLDPTVKVNVDDTDIKTAVDLAANLDSSTSMKVNVDDVELSNASDQIETLSTLTAIDLAINIAGTAKGFFDSLGRFSGVGGILELDDALATIEARTGRMIPNAEKLISDLYTSGWGESRTQIADVITQADQLKIAQDDLASATETAFQVAAVTGADVNQVLNTMDTMVKSGITPSYQAAGDVIVTGFQNGLNKSDDLLDSLGEYATKLGTMEISAEGALAILNSGLDQGVLNTDFLSDSIREFGIRLGEISTDENIAAAFEQLDELSDIDLAASLDAYEAGELTGDQFMQGIFDSIAQANEADPETANTLVVALFGTQAEDLGAEIWGNLSTDADAAFGDIEGRAEEAGNAASDSLGVIADSFLRNIEQMAVDLLSSDSLDLDTKLDDLKKKIQEATTTLASGGSVGDAIEIVFGIEGVDTALSNIERVFGQFTIALLEIVATIQDPTGLGDADKGTRAEIARLSTQQLPFDLKLANADELDTIFNQAYNRGVTLQDASDSLTTALDELMAEGDYEQLINLVDAIENSEGATPEAIAAFQTKYIDPLSQVFDDAIANGDFDLAKKISDAQNDPTAYTDAIKGEFGFDAAAFDASVASFNTGMETAIAAENPTADMLWASLWEVPEEVTTSISNFETTTDQAMTNAALVTSLASDEMILLLQAMEDGFISAEEAVALADAGIETSITGNTITASFDAMSTSATENSLATVAAFQKVLATVSSVDASMSAFFNGVMAKVSAVNSAIEGIGTVPSTGGGGGSTTVNNVNVNNTVNTQSPAQAAQAGYQMGAIVRGMD